MNHLCSHGMNPASCPTCFRLAPVTPKKQPDIKRGPVVPYIPPVQPGDATERVTMRQARENMQSAAAAKSAPQPYSESAPPPPEAYTGEKLWEPRQHRGVINSLRSHPNANDPNARAVILSNAPVQKS